MTEPASCVFCQIATEQLPSEIVRADDEFLAFRDVQPRAATHVLVVPRSHVEQLDEWVANGGSSDRMLAFVRAVAADLGVEGRYRLITNVGEEAGQVVPHLHWHVLAGKKLPGFG
ncbi:MAG: nickel transporter [Thermoleophilia bacterium]|jgi:histidine triad (HIT) family protein|nr:nickel transporter [Thermoleophilia bacterium]